MEGSHELVLPNEDLSFRMFLFEGKDGNYVREKHWHRSIEMFVVLEGKLDFYINEEDIHLDKKTFVIVNSNELHSISASLPNKTIVLQMPLQTFERYYTDEQFICFTHRERVQDEQLVELVEKMYATYQEKEIGYELQVQSYFYRLLYLMVTKYRKMNVSGEIVREHRNRNRLSSITGYIKENFKEDLSLEGVAQSFGYSPTYLSRMFRKYAKINYKEYVQGIRLEYAYRELTGSDALVEEIAEHNGFADGRAFAKAFQMNMTEDDLKELMTSMTMSATASYDNNLQKLGYVDFANPSQISIYPMDFESKEKVVKILDSYNSRMEKEGKEEQIITYTDIVGTLMSSVTNIVDIISYVLIAFVAISLVVSSIMIGVITYISVLERKKEIGILRAIGASKRNVSQVFNAETVIIGLCAGLIGIGLSLLLLIPGNMIIHAVADNNKINAFLPVLPAIVLILLSIGLTLLGGIIPSRKAAKSDPVTALRTE